MKDKAEADTERSAPPDESQEVESWLREAVHAPHAARIPNPGDLIGGKYRIEELLGRGGMGVVFRARHTVSEKPVAIKWMLRPTTDQQAQRRFEREARAAGRIDHPNVIGLYDIGEEGDCSYLVMELLHGESLRDRLERGPIDACEAVETLIQAMRGVAAAHRAGVVHRDLKPDNIFLCQEPDGGPREAKVLDFGVSSIACKEAADSTLTQEGTLLGSLAYMSPEQLGNPHDVDARTDVYAFGVILYQVLTGTLPFRGANYSALAVAIVTTRPERPSQIRGDLQSGLEDVVLRALSREREERFADMNAMIEALLPFRPASVERSSGSRVSVAHAARSARSSVESSVSEPTAKQGALPIPVRMSTAGSDAAAGGQPRGKSRARIALAAASLLAIAALWALASYLRAEDPKGFAQPSAHTATQAPKTLPAEVTNTAPSVSATTPSLAAPKPAPAVRPAVPEAATTRAVERPTRPQPARPARRARGASPATKNVADAPEDILFSGRK